MKHITFGTLQLAILPTVYEPAEDSFLLATYASSLSGKILDVGTGCGIAALSAAAAHHKNNVVGLDLNPQAVKCAAANERSNGIANAAFLQSDLFSSVSDKFDYILFNPPYLPTTREEKLALGDENLAYDGGKTGLETFMRFASQAGNHLKPNGKVAVIATSLNDGIKKTLAELEKQLGPAQILAQESFFFEKLALIEAEKK